MDYLIYLLNLSLNDTVFLTAGGFMGFIQPLIGLWGAMQSQQGQKDQIAAQMDIANKNRASENARHSQNLKIKADENLLDAEYRNNQVQQGAFQDYMNIMRDTWLRKGGK